MTGEDKEQGPQKKEQKLTIRPAHGRQKLPHHPVVGKVVDVEGEAHVALAGVEERAAEVFGDFHKNLIAQISSLGLTVSSSV